MDTIHGDSSSKHTHDEQEHPTLGNKPEIEKVTRISSSSSSGGESFEEDLFQLDAAEPHKSFLQSTEIASDILASQSKTQNGKVTGTNDVGTKDNLDMFGPNHSPPLQVMDTSKISDPNRLASTMSNATDWSVFSNESLFSIQLRNSSLPRDNVLLFGRSQDLTNFPMDPYSPSETEVANAAVMQDVPRANAEKVGGKGKHPAGVKRHYANISDRFNNGMASFPSFAFPTLTKERRGLVNVEPVNQLPHRKQAEKPPPKTMTLKASLAAKWLSIFSRSCCSPASVSDQLNNEGYSTSR